MMKSISMFAVLSALALGGCHSSTPSATTPQGLQVTIEDGRLVVTDSIRFNTDSSELAPGSSDVLDAVARVLTTHSDIVSVRVEGHTDMHGAEDHNLELSTARANTVANYLREHGVTQPITAEGFGTSRHLCEDTTEACDARNRRVDFYVTSE